jgi:PAS domain S-box-containing protein
VETEADYTAAIKTAPDLILADYSLPQYDGLRALKQLRECGLDIPFILVSGQLGEEAAVEAMKLGASDYLLKDRLARLGAAVEGALEDKRLRVESQQRQAALRQSEESLRLAMDAAQMGSWDWDMRADVTLWSPYHEILWGYEPGTPLRSHADFNNRLHPEDVQRVAASIRQSIKQRTDYHCEFRVLWPDGSLHWMSSSGRIQFDAEGRPVRMLGMNREITRRKRRESNLQFLADMQNAFATLSSEAEFMSVATEQLAQHLGLVHCSLAEINEAADECTVLYNQSTQGSPALTGVHRLSDFYTQEERQVLSKGGTLVVNNVRDDLREEGRVQHFEALGIQALVNTGYVADGSWKFVLHASRSKPYAWPAEDIELLSELAARLYTRIQRARVEEALRESERDFRALAESVPQIVWATRPDGWNVYFNQHWVDYTGKSMEESHGHGWTTPFHPDDKQRAWEAWQNAVNTQGSYSLECRLRRADGVYRWWLIRSAPMFNGNGEIQKWFGTCTDIDDIKQAEQQIRQLNLDLETRVEQRTMALHTANEELQQQFEKRRQLEEEILHISEREQQRIGQDLHDDLGQQLAGVWMMSTVLTRNLAKSSPVNEPAASHISDVLKKAVAMTRNLARGLHPVAEEPGGLISALIDLAARVHDMFQVDCHFDSATDVQVEDNTIATHLYRIAQEAVSNAIKHGQAKHVNIRLAATAEAITLTVTDDGSGFAPLDQNRRGMGLRIMNYRADLIGAKVAIQKGQDIGTCVICTLPINPAPVAKPVGQDDH